MSSHTQGTLLASSHGHWAPARKPKAALAQAITTTRTRAVSKQAHCRAHVLTRTETDGIMAI